MAPKSILNRILGFRYSILFQENKNKNLLTKLVEEMEDNEEDIYLAPELFDSNSGSSKSFLSFLSWLSSSHSPIPNYDFVLITDDQSFVAIDNIANRLHRSIPTGSLDSGMFYLQQKLSIEGV